MRHHAGQPPADPASRQYQREELQYNGDNGRNGFNAQRGNGMHNGYVVNSSENLNQGYNGYDGHVNAEPQVPGRGQGRVYQYDERYHNDNNGPSRPNTRQQGGTGAQVGDARRRAQSKRKQFVI